MNSSLLNALNSDQRIAVEYSKGPLLILAGAGSGKTRVLTYKIAYLMSQKKVPGTNILAVTFTNKAASELKQRIQNLVEGNSTLLPRASTFHSLAASILRINGRHIGLSKDFVIYDTNDQKEAIKEVMKNRDISHKNYRPNSIKHTISAAKNELISALDYTEMAYGLYQQTVAAVYRDYEQLLKRNQALDFDDLLLKTVELLSENIEVRGFYKQKYEYILIDEYQDTNQAQYMLTKLLCNNQYNICVVGDASQSIYAWRGADISNILNFKKDFPNVETFNLERNYRSTQTILDGAHSVISKNTSHPILHLWTDKQKGQEITIYEAHNEHEEADFVLNEIALHGIYPGMVAVLYRTNAQSRVLEEVLLHRGIPYSLVGGVRFYERKEVKDVISYLRLVVNDKDSISKNRIIKIGKRRTQKFYDWLEERKKDIQSKPSIEILDEILKVTKYLVKYDEQIDEERSRLENIKELRSVAMQFPLLIDFLENIALVENDYVPNSNLVSETGKITLMTLHGAKGLEFDTVFMVGMEEGLFPHSRALTDAKELEEERRLCYVGMTRAKERLYLTYAKNRLYFGSRMTNIPSRFIADLPEDLLDLRSGSNGFSLKY